MRISILKVLSIVDVAADTALPSLASPIVFSAAGQIAGGGRLSGTVTIDTATGGVLATDLSSSPASDIIFANGDFL